MYTRTVPGPEKQPSLREFLDEPDTPLDIRVPPPPRDVLNHHVYVVRALPIFLAWSGTLVSYLLINEIIHWIQ